MADRQPVDVICQTGSFPHCKLMQFARLPKGNGNRFDNAQIAFQRMGMIAQFTGRINAAKCNKIDWTCICDFQPEAWLRGRNKRPRSLGFLSNPDAC
jgi:hypothetical protein